ncbi:hypothetical protein I4U23_015235 [Adineta vaga]|nr:hypothetical protein I4U23_015235 [Adineta vaga]
MRYKLFILFSILIAVFIAVPFTYPRYTEEDDVHMLEKYLSIKQNLLSVMTFNIRFDGIEHDPNNHFTKRVYRLTETIGKWQPAILGVQEPFTDQLLHLQSHLPNYYQHVGYQHHGTDKNHPSTSSQHDFKVAILYNDQQLKLLEQDYLWLSKTPRTVGSKDWNSGGARTLNIARFELINTDDSTEILVFNTHLDVQSEQARQEQAKLIRSIISQWQQKYPTAILLLLGDFNAMPNQTAYQILTFSDFLYDTWIVCKSHRTICLSNSFSSTFHGWFGSLVNTYGIQILQTILFTFHGTGVKIPYNIPTNYSAYIDIVKQLLKFCRLLNLSDMISLWSSHRFHVDWILYQNSKDRSKDLQPQFISVVDIRSRNYSSDHFPVIALFKINTQLDTQVF